MNLWEIPFFPPLHFRLKKKSTSQGWWGYQKNGNLLYLKITLKRTAGTIGTWRLWPRWPVLSPSSLMQISVSHKGTQIHNQFMSVCPFSLWCISRGTVLFTVQGFEATAAGFAGNLGTPPPREVGCLWDSHCQLLTWQSRGSSGLCRPNIWQCAVPTGSTVPGGPIGGQTRVSLRNEHMQYIITW